MRYLFQLGRERELSAAELRAVFSLLHISFRLVHSPDPQFLIIETDAPLNIPDLMQRLGGTIKIGQQIDESISQHLRRAQPTGKILFSLTNGQRDAAPHFKKELQSAGRAVRYIEPKNTATILHNALVERQGDITMIGTDAFATVALQPMEAFAARDYGRPRSNAWSGMLPPKLARMMINLASLPKDATILDPFCGSGTILMEATLLGYAHLIGSDLSQRAVEDTRKNLDWLNMRHQQLFMSDVRDLPKKLPARSVHAIVTEPYLGKPLRGNESEAFLQNQIHDLSLLYADTFRAYASLLTSGGVVVMALPAFRHGRQWIRIPHLDDLASLGFHPESLGEKTTLLYARPTHHVGREIGKWTFTG